MFARYLRVPSETSAVLGGNRYIHSASTRCHDVGEQKDELGMVDSDHFNGG